MLLTHGVSCRPKCVSSKCAAYESYGDAHAALAILLKYVQCVDVGNTVSVLEQIVCLIRLV